jgi:hypothetical protein
MVHVMYAPMKDRKGRDLHPGDRVRVKTYPRGTVEGVLTISKRVLEVMPDGSTLPALALQTEDGTIYGSLSSKGCLKLS